MTGDVNLTRQEVKQSIEDRFWSKVKRGEPDECWLWTASMWPKENGYGTFYLHGKRRPAHRVAWEMHHGREMPSDLYACHHCDTPSCVNPAHIFAGTQADNLRDAREKGRKGNKEIVPSHCNSGHDLSPENLYFSPDGRKWECRQCQRIRWERANRKKQRAVALGLASQRVVAAARALEEWKNDKRGDDFGTEEWAELRSALAELEDC